MRRRSSGIVGETPNLAARLQGIAEPNTVVIAESTRKLLGNLFELEDLGAQELKGIAGPVRAWAALRPSAVESRFEALRTATTPLVGRDEEMDAADAALGAGQERARARSCSSPASRASASRASPRPWWSGLPASRTPACASSARRTIRTAPSTRSSPTSNAPPASAATTRAEQRLDKLEALLAQATNDLGGVAPLFADLLAVPTGERYPPLNLTPQKRKEKTLTALTAQVEGLSAREPVLMVYEDVHWSDPTTREFARPP